MRRLRICLFLGWIAACTLPRAAATREPVIGDLEIPRLCRVLSGEPESPIDARWQTPVAPVSATGLPAGARGWECIPGVIRNDGVETFRLEVDTNGPVSRVWLDNLAGNLVLPGPSPLDLRDDGLGQDQVAGDYVFTAGPFRYNTAWAFPPYFRGDAASPAGLYVETVGFLHVQETGGSTTRFLIFPSIGLVRADVPTAPVSTAGTDVAITPHAINVRSSTRETQRLMRGLGGNPSVLSSKIYAALPDVFDFLMLCSSDKVEWLPYTTSSNYTSGLHLQVSVDYTGTGYNPFNNASLYGSAGRLKSVNALDAYDRGLLANNATHEITHQWASHIHPAIGLSDGSGHYQDTSVGSLVGGFLWSDNQNGTFTRNCDEGRNGGHHSPPLDLYMMGLIEASQVPILYRSQMPSFSCTDPITSYDSRVVADIQAVHGVRTPGPAASQKAFSIGFVVETRDRFLSPTERTFFDVLASHYTKVLAQGDPDPYVGFNWAPVTRYFGNGTTWRSDVQGLITGVPGPGPKITTRLAIAPNPASSVARLEWEVSGGRSSRIEILDLQGRHVRRLERGPAVGAQQSSWDGRDDRGRTVPAGVYLVHLSSAGEVATRRLVWLP